MARNSRILSAAAGKRPNVDTSQNLRFPEERNTPENVCMQRAIGFKVCGQPVDILVIRIQDRTAIPLISRFRLDAPGDRPAALSRASGGILDPNDPSAEVAAAFEYVQGDVVLYDPYSFDR
jgi:hypothetical protein